jgi:hypothetical protein
MPVLLTTCDAACVEFTFPSETGLATFGVNDTSGLV